MDRAAVTMPREHSGSANAQDIDVVALADVEDERPERDVQGLRDPRPLVCVEVKRRGDEGVGYHALGLGKLVGDLAHVDRTVLLRLSRDVGGGFARGIDKT